MADLRFVKGYGVNRVNVALRLEWRSRLQSLQCDTTGIASVMDATLSEKAQLHSDCPLVL
ncbi:MAG: hypothetical protein WBA57_25750 [Elainellaceae cyanobacterium]